MRTLGEGHVCIYLYKTSVSFRNVEICFFVSAKENQQIKLGCVLKQSLVQDGDIRRACACVITQGTWGLTLFPSVLL